MLLSCEAKAALAASLANTGDFPSFVPVADIQIDEIDSIMGKVTHTHDKALDPSSKINGKFPVEFNESEMGPRVLLIFAHNSSEPSVLAFNDFENKKKSIPLHKLFKINLENISLYKIHLQL